MTVPFIRERAARTYIYEGLILRFMKSLNPFKLRQFAKASGILAKNDRLDARMIALFTSVMPTRPAQQRHPATERLAQIVTARRELSDDCRERRGQS
jgi:transposase